MADEQPTLEQLKGELAAAIASNDDTAMMAVIGKMAKQKSEIAKAQAEAARKEAEALARTREKESAAIFKDIRKAIPDLAERLQAVKATGFTFNVDHPDKEGVMTTYKSVALAVPTIKKRRGGTGGGAVGKSKDEFGVTLGEIFDKFATDEDRAELAAAESNSKQWQIKVRVKKAAIANGRLKPVS